MSLSATQVNIKTLLSQLVSIPTLSQDPATCLEALEFIKAQVAGLPLRTTDFSYNGHPALIMTTCKTKRPRVLFLAHADVMHAPPEMFELREQDGRYYGRGVSDMKFAVATYVRLLNELGGDLPEYDLGVIITTDEELAGENTAAELVRLGWGAGVVINPDAVPDWNVETAAKGYCRYRIESEGKSGHGSRPWLYRNTIKQLMGYLNELELHYPVEEPCGDAAHKHATFSVNVIRRAP